MKYSSDQQQKNKNKLYEIKYFININFNVISTYISIYLNMYMLH